MKRITLSEITGEMITEEVDLHGLFDLACDPSTMLLASTSDWIVGAYLSGVALGMESEDGHEGEIMQRDRSKRILPFV